DRTDARWPVWGCLTRWRRASSPPCRTPLGAARAPNEAEVGNNERSEVVAQATTENSRQAVEEGCHQPMAVFRLSCPNRIQLDRNAAQERRPNRALQLRCATLPASGGCPDERREVQEIGR